MVSGPKRKRGALDWLLGGRAALDADGLAALARVLGASGAAAPGGLPEVLATGR